MKICNVCPNPILQKLSSVKLLYLDIKLSIQTYKTIKIYYIRNVIITYELIIY